MLVLIFKPEFYSKVFVQRCTFMDIFDAVWTNR